MMITIGGALFAVILFLTVMGVLSHFQTPELGIQKGKLRACPDKPNCVSSEGGEDQQHAVFALKSALEADVAWLQFQRVVHEAGGHIIQHGDDYLHAEFSSTIFQFVDDLEARFDRQSVQIHVRSASRVGHSDLSVNRKRIERLRIRFEEKL